MSPSSIPPEDGGNAPEIADASSLFGAEPAPAAKPSAPIATGRGEVFEVEEAARSRAAPSRSLAD